MGFLRKKRQPDAKSTKSSGQSTEKIGYNPNRTEHLFWYTEDGYLVAQDVVCQHEYVEAVGCAHCGGHLLVAAHLNRSGQGLSELVAVCDNCGARANFIFDISNDVYQNWWQEQLGALYVRQHDDPPRAPHHP
ncbi:MAG: hypothetical protein JXQ72_00820 [Anaerolineae bacterium]|nr:hypothetical protein [Anaerolineae bacterium]